MMVNQPKNPITNPAVWSNVLWYVPAGLAIYYEAYWLAIPACIVVGTSTLYHLYKNPFIERLDELCPGLYVVLGPYLLHSVGWPLTETLLAAALMIIGLGIFLYSHRVRTRSGLAAYRRVHMWWHIFSAASASVVYLAYLG